MSIKIVTLVLMSLLVLTQTSQGQQETHEFLWNYYGDYFQVSISSDGSYIAAGSYDDQVSLFNREGMMLWSKKMEYPVNNVAISSDGSYIAATIPLSLFDRNGMLLWSYGESYFYVAISSDGSYIAAGSSKDQVSLFNREGKLLWSYRTGDSVEGISISANGSYIVVASSDQNVYFFNRDGKLIWKNKIDKIGGSEGHISISPDGAHILYGSNNGIYLFNHEGKLVRRMLEGTTVSSVSVFLDGLYVTTRSGDVLFFDYEGELIWKYDAGSSIYDASILDEGSYIATASGFDVNLFTNNKTTLLANHDRTVRDVKYILEISKKEVFIMRLLLKKETFLNILQSIEGREYYLKGTNENTRKLISQAEEAFDNGEYSKARQLALDASQEVDEYSNFTIENYYIYATCSYISPIIGRNKYINNFMQV